MPWQDIIKLAFGHSLIGVAPPVISSKEFEAARKAHQNTDVESYGLFDSATPNFATYYPNVSADDLKPKEGDYVNPIFRALSEVTVHKLWNPVNFGVGGVLKKSMNLLKGQTIYPNHEALVGNELGAIPEVFWEESYKAGNVQIPAGINATLKIDGKAHPNIARAVMSDPPSVHSTSVTVQFLWEKSHTSLTEQEFFNKLGTYDKDGRLIERIATDIKRYNEISLVAHGADPFAQKVNDKGQIVNPTYADVTYKLSADEKKTQKFFFFDYKEDIIKNSTIPTEFKEETPKLENSENMNKILALIALTAAGIKFTLPKPNEEANIDDNQAALAEAFKTVKLEDTAEVTRLKEVETKYNLIKDKDIASLEAFKTTALTAARNKALATYTKLMDNAPDTGITALIANADLAAVEALEKQYQTQLDAKYPVSCGDCGSTKVARKSSKTTEEQNSNNNEETVTSPELKMAEYIKKNSGTFGIHQTEFVTEPAK